MPIVEFGRIDSDASPEDILNAIARIQKGIDYLMQGGLDSKNAREFGGWLVGNTELQSKNKTVGMSTEDTPAPAPPGVAVDDIRFWAGDVKTGTPKFKVTKGGILTTIAAIFMSALGYPRVELNSANNLIAAYVNATTYVAFLPSYNSVPALVLVDAGLTKAFLNRSNAVSGTTLGTFDSEPLNFQASGPLNLNPTGNLQINGTNGFTGSLNVITSVNFVASTTTSKTINFTKGVITSIV